MTAYHDQSQKNVITDFSTEQTDKIFQSCDLLSCSMSTQSIVVTFKFKIEYDKQEFKMKKKQAAAVIVNSVINSAEANLSESTILNLNSQHHSNS